MAEINNKRSRDDELESDSNSNSNSRVAKRLRDDLLEKILDDSELAEETQDLDSVMKSFEQEISKSKQAEEETSDSGDSGDSQPELGYLFEASDDELGLPPAFSEEESLSNNLPSESEAVGLDQMWRFEDEIPSYDFGGIGDNSNGEFLALDGLFDYSDVYSGGAQSDFSDFFYRPESLPAL